MRNFPRIKSEKHTEPIMHPRVLDFEQLKSKKNPIRGGLKEISRTVGIQAFFSNEESRILLPHLYAHAEAAKKAPILPSASYHLRLGYHFEAIKDLVKESSFPSQLFREYCITSPMLAPCFRAEGSSYQPVKTYYGNSQKVCGRGHVRIGTRRH